MDDFDLYRLFKTLHVLAVTLLAAGIGVENVVGPLLPRARNTQELRALATVMGVAGKYVIPVAAR